MRETLRERRHQLHRGFPMPRLLTMFLMMAILGLIFVRLRDPSTWHFMGGDDDRQVAGGTAVPAGSGSSSTQDSDAASKGSDAASKGSSALASAEPKGSGAASAAPPELTPTGPTDTDPEEMEEIKPSLSTIYDGYLETMPSEQPAYFRILGWVDHQPTELLRKRAVRDFFYDNLTKTPQTMRLQIVELRLNVKQIVRVFNTTKDGKLQPTLSPEGKQLYEVRGVTQESGSNLYFGMVTDVPPEMPIGTFINEDARLVGYFFKVQGYYSQKQQLDSELSGRKMKPLKAPLIIGRLVWLTQPATSTAGKAPVWVLAPIGGVAIIVIVGWVYWNSRRPPKMPFQRVAGSSGIDPDAPSVDSWLDQAQTGSAEIDLEPTAHSDGAAMDQRFASRFSGNIFDDICESNNGHAVEHEHYSNGHLKNGASGPEPEVRENDSPGS